MSKKSDVQAIAVCVDALQSLDLAARRAAMSYLWDRLVEHPPTEDLAIRARELLEEQDAIPPAQRFQSLVAAGLVDDEGRLLPPYLPSDWPLAPPAKASDE